MDSTSVVEKTKHVWRGRKEEGRRKEEEQIKTNLLAINNLTEDSNMICCFI